MYNSHCLKGGVHIQALILGGTKGLGREIARAALVRDIKPIIVGRSAKKASEDRSFEGARFIEADLCDYDRLPNLIDHLGYLPNINFVFWVAGLGVQGPLVSQSLEQIWSVFNTNIVGPTLALRLFLIRQTAPFHLITIASTTSWKIRSQETVYGMAKAAQAQGSRNLHQEMLRDLPGSKSTLINPGGMNTPFWEETGVDSSKFMDPAEIAEIIWNQVLNQKEDWCEMQIIRGEDGKPAIEFGPKLPQL